jgi:hypothetical protein
LVQRSDLDKYRSVAKQKFKLLPAGDINVYSTVNNVTVALGTQEEVGGTTGYP